MNQNKHTLVLLICFFLISCSSNSASEFNEDKLIEFADSKGFELSKVEKLLVIPTEVSCESCVFQIVTFLNSLVLPPNIKFVFSSYSRLSVETFIKENEIELSDQFYFDEDNFFFVNNLIMIHPVLFERKKKVLTKSEIFPVNVFETLQNIFDQDGCNQKMIDEILDLEIKGILASKKDTDEGKSTLLLFKDINDEKKETQLKISKESADLLLKYFSIDDFVQKRSKTFKIQVLKFLSDSEAESKIKTIKCK
jgi:hypothetical protein